MAYDVPQLLAMSQMQLDDLFRASPPGDIPNGEAAGTAIIAPGTIYSQPIAEIINHFDWQGKVFDAQTGILKNRILVFGVEAIIAKVYKGPSWLDGKECIVLDYSDTSLVAQWIRDEIRLIDPNFYLGKVYWGKRAPDRLLPEVLNRDAAVAVHGGRPVARRRASALRALLDIHELAAGHGRPAQRAGAVRRVRAAALRTPGAARRPDAWATSRCTACPAPASRVPGLPRRLRRARRTSVSPTSRGRAAAGLRAIFAHCEGFEARQRPAGLDASRTIVPIAASYVNWVGRTVRQIREESALRQRAGRARAARAARLGGGCAAAAARADRLRATRRCAPDA